MMAAAIDLADHLAQMSPVAVQGTKVNMNYSRDHSVDEGLEYIVRFLSTYHIPAVLVFNQKCRLTHFNPRVSNLFFYIIGSMEYDDVTE